MNNELFNISIFGTSDSEEDFTLYVAYMVDASSSLDNVTIPAIYANEDTDTHYQDEITVTVSSSFDSLSMN